MLRQSCKGKSIAYNVTALSLDLLTETLYTWEAIFLAHLIKVSSRAEKLSDVYKPEGPKRDE